MHEYFLLISLLSQLQLDSLWKHSSEFYNPVRSLDLLMDSCRKDASPLQSCRRWVPRFSSSIKFCRLESFPLTGIGFVDRLFPKSCSRASASTCHVSVTCLGLPIRLSESLPLGSWRSPAASNFSGTKK